MTINDRFRLIIDQLYGGNKSAFAAAVGVTPSVVDNIVGRRAGKPSFDVLVKTSAIAEINTTWLVTGEGEMLKRQPAQSVGNGATAIGENAIAGAVIHGGINEKGGLPDAVLQERIESLEKLLAEKERLIQVLLKVKVPSEGSNS